MCNNHSVSIITTTHGVLHMKRFCDFGKVPSTEENTADTANTTTTRPRVLRKRLCPHRLFKLEDSTLNNLKQNPHHRLCPHRLFKLEDSTLNNLGGFRRRRRNSFLISYLRTEVQKSRQETLNHKIMFS